ncbi:MAG: DUF3365 domain-containing protein [Salinimicrobium sp.]
MKKPISIAAALLLLLGCKQNEPVEMLPVAEMEIMAVQEHAGQKLLEQYCYACHSPSAPMDKMLAPPMAAVKAHYLLNEPSKEEFVEQITAYVAAPSKEASKMPGAINKFGLMPQQNFPPEAVEKIAAYLYEYKIEEPEWFSDHFNAGPGKGMYGQQGKQGQKMKSTGQTYRERGVEIAMAAEKHLGQQLMKQLREKNTIDALQYCNENALPLTKEVALKEGASIQRVSDKNRNPKNLASKKEKILINQFRRDIAWGHQPEPVVIDEEDSVRFYYPLVTNELCLQCHGRVQDMDPKVQQKVLQLYPQDKAVGYSENQVRGLWKIGIPKPKQD